MAAVLTIPPALRSGTLVSATRTIPASGAERRIRVRADCDAATLRDPGTSFRLRLEQSRDAGATWRMVAGCGVRGVTGLVSKSGGPPELPGFQLDVDVVRGAEVRLTIEIDQPITLGLLVDAL